MITPFGMYLFTRLDNVSGTLCFLGAVSVVVLIFLFVFYVQMKVVDKNDEAMHLLKRIKQISILTVICWCLIILVPNQKEMAAIYLVPKIVNNEKINNISGNILLILEQKTKEWLDFTQKKK